MKKFLPIIFFITLVGIFFRPVILHKNLPIPIDALVGLYNPYRDFYAPTYLRGVPFKNFLITDPFRQQYPWRYLSVDQIKHGKIPLWNPYNFTGEPLLGIMQGASFYPLNFLYFFLPFSSAWSLQVFLEPLLSGIFMFFYLKKLKLTSAASLLGGLIYAFSGFSVVWLEWNTVLHVTLWLPLILLIKEKLLERFTFKFALILIFIEVSTVFAGYLQILFYVLCISNLYLLVRILQKSMHGYGSNYFLKVIKLYFPFLVLGFVMFGFSMVQIFPAIKAILYSARDLDQLNLWKNEGWFIPWQNLIQFLVPDFFGNPATLNYWGVWNYAELVGYVGIVPLVLALFALFLRRDKKTLFFGMLLIVSLIFSLPTFLAKIPYLIHLPFISTAQPTRLIFVVDFSLSILSALGLDYFLGYLDKSRKPMYFILGIISVIYLSLWIIVLGKIKFFGISPEQFSTARQNLILPSVIFAIFVVLLLGYYNARSFVILRLRPTSPGRRTSSSQWLKNLLFGSKGIPRFTQNDMCKMTLIIAIILLTAFDLLRFAEKFTPFSSRNYLFPHTKAISFLEYHLGNYRFASINDRILPPNTALMYKLQSIDGYDPLYLKNYGEFIASIERNNPNINPPFGFNRIISPKNYQSSFFNLLGVKYILSLTDIINKNYKKVFQEGETRVYENTDVFPRAFFANKIIFTKNNQDTINKLFINKEHLLDTVVIQNSINFNNNFGRGIANISSYSEEHIIIKTENNQSGLLVLTDAYYPTWRVFIDGVNKQMLLVDYVFRGVIVPHGNHTVEFINQFL